MSQNDTKWKQPGKSLGAYAQDARYQPQLPPPEGWLSAIDAGIRLGVSASQVRWLVMQAILEKGYIGSNLFVSVASIERYQQERKPAKSKARAKKAEDEE